MSSIDVPGERRDGRNSGERPSGDSGEPETAETTVAGMAERQAASRRGLRSSRRCFFFSLEQSVALSGSVQQNQKRENLIRRIPPVSLPYLSETSVSDTIQ